MAASTEAAGAKMEAFARTGDWWRRWGYNPPSHTSRGRASGTVGAGDSQQGGKATVVEVFARAARVAAYCEGKGKPVRKHKGRDKVRQPPKTSRASLRRWKSIEPPAIKGCWMLVNRYVFGNKVTRRRRVIGWNIHAAKRTQEDGAGYIQPASRAPNNAPNCNRLASFVQPRPPRPKSAQQATA